MNVRISLLTSLLASFIVLSGCAAFNAAKEGVSDTYDAVFDTGSKSSPINTEDDTPIIILNSKAADSLYYYTGRESELPEGSPIYVHNFTNENDPGDNSRFGRIVANQIAGRLAQHEMFIVDGAPQPIKPDNATAEDGTPLAPEDTPRPAMLTGTYFIGDTVIYLNAKLIRLDDNAVVSGKSWTLPINDNTRSLLPQFKSRNTGIKPAVQDTF